MRRHRISQAVLALVIAVPGVMVMTAPAAAAATVCEYHETPPPAPTTPTPGYVLWSPPADTTTPNTVIGYIGDDFNTPAPSDCAPDTLNAPSHVDVAPGAALRFWGSDTSNEEPGSLIVPWGGTFATGQKTRIPDDVYPVGAVPNWGGTTTVQALDAAVFASSYGTCPDCDLTPTNPAQNTLSLPGQQTNDYGVPFVKNTGNFAGTIFKPGLTITGSAVGTAFTYRFDGAKLDNTTFLADTYQLNGDAASAPASFRNVSAKSTKFGMQLSDGAIFDGSDLTQAMFTGVRLLSASFLDVTVDGTQFGTGTILSGSSMRFNAFRNPPSFAGAALDDGLYTTFGELPCITFKDSDLVGVSFDNAQFFGVCRPSTMFAGSRVSLTVVKDLIIDVEPISGLPVAPADLTGAQVVSSPADFNVLKGLDMKGLDLSAVDVVGVPLDLTGTQLDGATLTDFNFSLATLAGASLTNVSAAGANFEGADLRARGSAPAANLSGAKTNLQGASFIDADISGVGFVGADIGGAVFTGARAASSPSSTTDFSGVRATNAIFSDAHIYGNGQAFDAATDMSGVDFTGAVLAADASGGGFDLTDANLTGAKFDDVQCINCNFTNATLNQASFTGGYLPGLTLSGATVTGASFDRAWLYCGSTLNAWCKTNPANAQQWLWPLLLGSGEVYGPVPFGASTLSGPAMADVVACPSGKPGQQSPAGCAGFLLPQPAEQPPIPAACSASAQGACPTPTSTLFPATAPTPADPKPVELVATAPPTWNTPLDNQGWYVSYDDATVRQVQTGGATAVAGTAGSTCGTPTSPCGDGGPASAAQLSRPTGLAVGSDGALYIADPGVLRVRRVAPAGTTPSTITTVAGTGAACTAAPCGDGGQAVEAQLTSPNDVAVDVSGLLYIADGPGGVRRVFRDGAIDTLAPGSATGDVVSIVLANDGALYAATRNPDLIVKIDAGTGAVTTVVGTGTSGYNGTTDQFGVDLPGNQVQVKQPDGLSMNLAGNVVFADAGNNLIRGYVPAFGTVIDQLAGTEVGGLPQAGGFNGDGHYATQTQLNGPLAVAATDGPLLVIADTGNQRVRQVGPGPVEAFEGPEAEPPQVVQAVVSCRPGGAVWACQRLPRPSGRALTIGLTTSVQHQGVEFASGRWLLGRAGRIEFLVTETRPLVPGQYDLQIAIGRSKWSQHISLTHP